MNLSVQDWILVAVIIGVVVSAYLSGQSREKQIRAYARKSRFAYGGLDLPPNFPYERTSFAPSLNTDIVTGVTTNGAEFVFFDQSPAGGKAVYSETLVAIRRPLPATQGLASVQVDDWTILYRPKKRLSVAEIDALLKTV